MSKGHDNLIPITSETAKELGSKGGKAKAGSKHLKTLIQEIGSNIDWSKTTLKDKDKMQRLYGNNAWEALVYVQLTKAMAGDPKAAEWLAKNGYGTNIDITTDGNPINVIVEDTYGTKPKFRTTNDTTTEAA